MLEYTAGVTDGSIFHMVNIADLRKIFSTSDYAKVHEGFIKDWVMEDICDHIDISQVGGEPQHHGLGLRSTASVSG